MFPPKRTKLLSSAKYKQGFTLIETIVGIVTLSVSFAILSTFLFPAADQSASHVHQIKAAELGQSFLNEILGRAFDENSDMSGGYYRCGEEQNGTVVNCSTILGPDGGETRVNFNDVDDYIASDLTGGTLLNSIGTPIGEDRYIGYNVSINVCQAATYSDCNNTNNYTAKLITLSVTTPQDEIFVFSAYKGNY